MAIIILLLLGVLSRGRHDEMKGSAGLCRLNLPASGRNLTPPPLLKTQEDLTRQGQQNSLFYSVCHGSEHQQEERLGTMMIMYK